MVSRFNIIMVSLIFLFIVPSIGCGQTVTRTYTHTKQAKEGYLGVEAQDVNKKLKEKKNLSVDYGAYVNKVVEDSPAEKAGIQKGDVIIKVGEEEIEDTEDLIDAVQSLKPKSEVKIEIYRKTDKKTVTAKIGKLKLQGAYSFQFDDDGFRSMPPIPKVPKITKKLKIQMFSESEMQGLQIQSLSKQLGEYFAAPNGKGILVSEVEEGSNAAKAGFKAGDVITKVDNRSVDDVDELHEEFSDLEGKEASIEVIRNGKSMKLNLKIEEVEDDDEDSDNDQSVIITPGGGQMKTFKFDLPGSSDERMEKIHKKVIELKRNINKEINRLQSRIQNKLIES